MITQYHDQVAFQLLLQMKQKLGDTNMVFMVHIHYQELIEVNEWVIMVTSH